MQARSKAIGHTLDECQATLPDAAVFFPTSHRGQQRPGPAIVCLHNLQAPPRPAQDTVTSNCMATIQRRPVRCECHLMRYRHCLPLTKALRPSACRRPQPFACCKAGQQLPSCFRIAPLVKWGLVKHHPTDFSPSRLRLDVCGLSRVFHRECHVAKAPV